MKPYASHIAVRPLSQSRTAKWSRDKRLLDDEYAAEYNAKAKKARDKNKAKKIISKVKYNLPALRKISAVRHHLKRGRDVGSIAIAEKMTVSMVNLCIQEIEKEKKA